MQFTVLRFFALLAIVLAALIKPAFANEPQTTNDYRLAPGDTIRILVFQNQDLTLETRVSEGGTISFPLIGNVRLGGLTLEGAERQIAMQLLTGGFVQQPQVTVVLLQNRGNQVSVLGQVNRPGRYPLETTTMRLTEMIATAGGIASTGSDTVVVMGKRKGEPLYKEVDIAGLFLARGSDDDIVLAGGDSLYVHRAPLFYIYGEAQRPGAYRIERGMTIRQAIAQGGGPTARGTEKDPRVNRRKADGRIEQITPEPSDLVQANDVIYIRESLF